MKFRNKPLATLISGLFAGALLTAGSAVASNTPQVQDLGATPTATTQTVSIVLQLHNVPQLEKFIASTVDPYSNNYRQFLSVEDFTALYAPSDRDIERVKSDLKKLGITVNEVYRNHLVIRATGTTAQLNQYFNTELHTYQESSQRYIKPNRAVTIPNSVSDVVLTVAGLNTKQFARPHLRRTADTVAGSPIAPVKKASLLNATTGNALGQLTVADVANLYNITPLYARHITGRGRTIGIATMATFTPADAYAYWAAVGLNVSQTRIKQRHLDGGAGTDGADETTLDVEQSGGLAPGAEVIVYDAPNTDSGFMDLFFKAAADNKVDTLSTSWGSPEIAQSTDVVAGQHQAFLELAAQGISVFASAGDAGAYDINDANNSFAYPGCSKTLTVDSPASDPYVVAAGGTTLPSVISIGNGTVTVPAERPWGWDYLENYVVANYGQAVYDQYLFPVGNGGGVSVSYPIPRYQSKTPGIKTSVAGQSLICQTSTGPQDLADLPAAYAGRNVPDLSLNADPNTGYAVYSAGAWIYGYGGTSFVAPQLNGITALVSESSHSRLGFLNPQLYARLTQFGYGNNSPFKSITSGDNLYWQATPSYNPGSGIGTLNVNNLAKSFSQY